MSSLRPLLLVTGFLGSGKTTLIRELLAVLSQSGTRADVILNDIANANIDAASINPDHAASISPLAASCACCESLEDLLTLCRTAARGDGGMLVIELNGTADPLGLLESFALLEKHLPFAPTLQVCVIDVRNWGARGELDPIERRQMESAGLHLLSHTDRAETADIRKVEAMISNEFPGSRRISARELAMALEDRSPLPATVRSGPVPSRHDEVHLLSHQVRGHQVPLPPKVRQAAIERLLENLPPSVLRAKALVKLTDAPGTRWLFEKCGGMVSPAPVPAPGISNLSSSLLCMGLRLDREAIETLVSDAFGPIRYPGP